jgi:hypothetical protein
MSHRRIFVRRKFRVFLCLMSTALFAMASTPTTGSYQFTYSKTAHDQYTTIITSTFNKTADCTITWTGTGTDGNPNNGSRGYVVPPYSGRGTAITSVANFSLELMNASAICSPRN